MAKKRGIHVTDLTDHGLSIAETNISEEQADSSTKMMMHLKMIADPILDYINSQHHQEDDINHALQAYNIMTSPFSDTTTPAVHQLGPYPPVLPCCSSKTSPTWFTC